MMGVRRFSTLLASLALMTVSGSAWSAPSTAPLPSAAVTAPAASATGNAPGKPSAAADEAVASDSPRAALSNFRHLTRTGDFAAAAEYLDLSTVDQTDGPELARKLRQVLNRHLWIDPKTLSASSRGNPLDPLGADKQLLGQVPGASGAPEPVVLVRNSYQADTHWLFSAGTVANIETWYDHLGNLWVVEHLPKTLLRMGPHHLRRWQWLALLPLVAAGWFVGFAVTRLARLGFNVVLHKPLAEIAHKLRGPASLGVAVGACYLLLPYLGLYEPAELQVNQWFDAALLIAVFWALWQTVELSQRHVGAHWAKDSLTAHSLLLLGARLAKFGVVAIAAIVVLAELGYHATTIITGLGIGGIALALAAQKTVENLFGAFSLAIDQPFREGDTIQFDTVNGTVETIGLRSTRIRTADRTIISIPNGKLADLRIETINRQDRLRFYCVVAVAHAARAQVTNILSAIDGLLRAEPLVDKASVGVHFVGLSDSAMNIEVGAMLNTMDGNAFAAARQTLLLGIVEVIEQAGCTLAHPVRSLELSAGLKKELTKPSEPQVPESGKRVQTEGVP